MKSNLKSYLISFACLIVIGILIFTSSNEVFGANTGSKGYIKDKSKVIILVGDSRVMQMSYMNSNNRKNFLLVFSNGGGINCINPNGGSRWIGNLLESALKKHPKAPVVFALGVNSNGNPISNTKRTKVYDYYIKNYPSHTYIISTVGGTGKKTGSYKNSNIVSFNKKLKEKYVTGIDNIRKKTNNKNIYFYDLYSYLKDAKLLNPGKSNKGTRDGLHYTSTVYKKWLKNLRSFITFI